MDAKRPESLVSQIFFFFGGGINYLNCCESILAMVIVRLKILFLFNPAGLLVVYFYTKLYRDVCFL